MMNKTANKYSPEVRERAVRMVLDGAGQHESRWSAILSISAKSGCAPQTLNDWVMKVEVDTPDTLPRRSSIAHSNDDPVHRGSP